MNIQEIFRAVKDEPDQSTLIVAITAIENQGYEVLVTDKYNGSKALWDAEAKGELDNLPMRNGIVILAKKGTEEQRFRIHFLDNDALCFTDIDTPPVIYNPDFTTGFYESGVTN